MKSFHASAFLLALACSSSPTRNEISSVDRDRAHQTALLAAASLDKGEIGQARKLAHDALEIDPYCYDALVVSGRVDLAQDRQAEAESQFKQALDLEPGRPEAQIALGEAAFKVNHYEEALQDFARALSIDPHSAAALRGQARAYSALGRENEAIQALHEYLPMAQNDVEALLLMGRAQLVQKKVVDAEFYLTRAAELAPENVEVLNALGMVRLRCKQYDEAAGLFEAALAHEPQRADIHFNLGVALEQGHLGDAALVEKQYREALALDPVQGGSALRLADLLVADNRKDEAVKLLTEVQARPNLSEADRRSISDKLKSLQQR
jgi:Tfp pilus assembly protein PilF